MMSYLVPCACLPSCVYHALLFFTIVLVRAEALQEIPRQLRHLSDGLSSKESNSFIEHQKKIAVSADAWYDNNQSEVATNVSRVMDVQLQNLQSEVKAMQNVDGAALAKQKAEYDRQLKMQQSDLDAAEALTARKTSEMEDIRKINENLRRKAATLTAASHKVRSQITQLQNNITTAMDFMQQTLHASDSSLNSTELQVMKDLDKQDMMMQKLANVKHLNLLGMLQINSLGRASKQLDVTSSKQKFASANLVQGMLVTLEDYAKQKATTETNLENAFKARFQAGSKQLQMLRDEYEELSTTCEEERDLQKKLTVAVQHLERTYAQLLQQKQVLYKFFQNLGHRSVITVN